MHKNKCVFCWWLTESFLLVLQLSLAPLGLQSLHDGGGLVVESARREARHTVDAARSGASEQRADGCREAVDAGVR